MEHSVGVRLAGTLVLLALFWGNSARAADSPPVQKPLLWAADAEGGAPYISKDPNNLEKYVGFEVDLAAAFEKELGRKIEYKQYEFKSLVPGLLRGDFDIAMNGLELTLDRAKALRLSRPYYVYSLQLVARADETRFDSLESCLAAGCKVATLEDTAASRLLTQKGAIPKLYGNQVEPYRDLELGRDVDAVLLDVPIAVYYAKPNLNLKFVGKPVAPGFYVIGFRKDQEALAAQFDAAIGHLLDNGTLQRIYEKWGIWNEEQEHLRDGHLDDILEETGRKMTFFRYFPILWRGARMTVWLTVCSMLLAMAIGLPLAVSRLYGPAPLRWAAMLYVEFFRGIPVLILLFFLYFGLPAIAEYYHLPFNLAMPAAYAAILGFGLNYAAYESEIYRAGISSIPIGQWEAGASLGMSRGHTFAHIILPQSIRVILPPMTNDFVALFKDTSVVSVIAVEELTKQYQILSKSSLKYLEIGLVTAALYLTMSVPLSYLSRYLERRWGKGR